MASQRAKDRATGAKTGDTYAEQVANRIIEQLQQGTAPWQRPWHPGQLRRPFNPNTDKAYRGMNAVILLSEGRSDPRWMTYRQATAANAQVRKGERGTYLQFMVTSGHEPVTDTNGRPVLGDDGNPKTQEVKYERPRAVGFTVFNAEQIEGLPAWSGTASLPEWDRDKRVDGVLRSSGVQIEHVPGDAAYYHVVHDRIRLPAVEQFPTSASYYATALHELGHSTGHPARLNRELANAFGSQAYAKEELRAEIASLMLGDEYQLGHDPSNHVSYVQSWINVLKDDPREIFRAAADAEKIVAYITAREREAIEQTNMSQRAKVPHDLTFAEFSAVATIVHGGGGSTSAQFAGRILAYGVDQSDDEILRTAHRLEVQAALHQATSTAPLGQPKAEMPPSHVLEEYPDLVAKYVQRNDLDPGAASSSKTTFMDTLMDLTSTRDRLITIEETPELQLQQTKQTGMSNPSAVEKVYLTVPFEEKDAAKSAGAMYDKDAKRWYVGPYANTETVARWVPDPSKRVLSPEEEFANELANNGLLIPGKPIMDGTLQRVPVAASKGAAADKGQELSGAYLGHLDGHPAGYIQNFKLQTKVNWKYSAVSETLTPADRARLSADAAELSVKRTAERQAAYEATSKRIAVEYAALTRADSSHPYLVKKGLAGVEPVDAGVDAKGNLVIPLRDIDGRLWSTQRIGANGWKGFEKGGLVSGMFHVNARPAANAMNSHTPIFITEGYATAETVRSAMDNSLVISAMTAGNLEPVAAAIRAKFPDNPIVIAGDNDHHNVGQIHPSTGQTITNVGLTAARNAAEKVGAYATVPVFASAAKGTDWNDLASTVGGTAVRDALRIAAVLADRRAREFAQQQAATNQKTADVVNLISEPASAGPSREHGVNLASAAEKERTHGR